MAEPNLQIHYTALRRQVSIFLGYGVDPDSHRNAAKVILDLERVIASGMRRFYYCGHDWSFMRPTATLTTVADDGDYDLPDDYAGISAPLTFAAGLGHASVVWVGERQIRELRTHDTTTGVPKYAAVRPKERDAGSIPNTGQRHEILLDPTPDAVYVLTYKYQRNPDTISALNPYHYGGPQHSETVLTACLAAAEDTKEDSKDVQNAKFAENLAASIAIDKAMSTPDTLGYCGDPGVGVALRPFTGTADDPYEPGPY